MYNNTDHPLLLRIKKAVDKFIMSSEMEDYLGEKEGVFSDPTKSYASLKPKLLELERHEYWFTNQTYYLFEDAEGSKYSIWETERYIKVVTCDPDGNLGDSITRKVVDEVPISALFADIYEEWFCDFIEDVVENSSYYILLRSSM